MNQKTVQRVTENARKSQKIFRTFLGNTKEPKAFLRCFHLRPTSTGITIVSTLPYAAMRGISVNCAELAVHLDNLSRNLNKLLGTDEEQAKKLLYNFGFCARAYHKKQVEEDIQAAFIRGMLDEQGEYDGIQFVASELNLESENRFDVLGIKGDTLYVFELKKGRTIDVFAQISRYLNHFDQYRDAFDTLLQNYPNAPVPLAQVSKVKGVAVMRHAENSPVATWNSLVAQHKIDTWFYKQAISFQKLTV